MQVMSVYIWVYATFVLSMDVVTDMQVEVCNLQVMGGFTHVVGTEQLGYSCTLISGCGRLLGAHL